MEKLSIKNTLYIGLLISFLLVLGACGNGGSSSPRDPDVDMEGRWQGRFTSEEWPYTERLIEVDITRQKKLDFNGKWRFVGENQMTDYAVEGRLFTNPENKLEFADFWLDSGELKTCYTWFLGWHVYEEDQNDFTFAAEIIDDNTLQTDYARFTVDCGVVEGSIILIRGNERT